MKYDTLMPEDIEPYLNGRSWEDLKIGDEIAFPESNGGPTGESLVGLTFCVQQGPDHKMEMTCKSFDAKTGMHTFEGGSPYPLNLRELPDEVKSSLSFEGSDAYFASGLGLCTIGELGVCSSQCRCLRPFFGVTVFEASRTRFLIPQFILTSFCLPILPFTAGDIAQLNLPVGMKTVIFYECKGITGTAAWDEQGS